MATHVRSFSKINLGLAIGPARADGFHELTTMYQTLAVHDVVSISASRASETSVSLSSNHPWVPPDGRNTAWRIVERCLKRLAVTASVKIRIQKNLPIQGGMGAGSANAAAALLGLERELGLALPGPARLQLAAEIGSDVPLFLIGGAVLGVGRGERVFPLPDLPETACVIAMPEVGVSTPQAFRDWDALHAGDWDALHAGDWDALHAGEGDALHAGEGTARHAAERGAARGRSAGAGPELTKSTVPDNLEKLSYALASPYAEPGTSGIFCKPERTSPDLNNCQEDPAKAGVSDPNNRGQGYLQNDLAENSLLALVRTGIENDFEQVVFPIHPSLRDLKRILMGLRHDPEEPGHADSSQPAIYAALSGSGSALFGLYGSMADAKAAQQRVQALGVRTVVTHTLPRAAYWRTMFAG